MCVGDRCPRRAPIRAPRRPGPGGSCAPRRRSPILLPRADGAAWGKSAPVPPSAGGFRQAANIVPAASFHGIALAQLEQPVEPIVQQLVNQLEIPAALFVGYAHRTRTMTDHELRTRRICANAYPTAATTVAGADCRLLRVGPTIHITQRGTGSAQHKLAR